MQQLNSVLNVFNMIPESI